MKECVNVTSVIRTQKQHSGNLGPLVMTFISTQAKQELEQKRKHRKQFVLQARSPHKVSGFQARGLGRAEPERRTEGEDMNPRTRTVPFNSRQE